MKSNNYIYVGTTVYDEYIVIKNPDDAYKYDDYRFYRVDKQEFNSLVTMAKGTCISNPTKFAFNRLHQERKTEVIL